MHTDAVTKELKKKVFKAKGENIKQTIRMQVTFTLKNKLQKYILAKYDHFSAGNVSCFKYR